MLDHLGDQLGVRVLLPQPEQAPFDIEIIPTTTATQLAQIRRRVKAAAATSWRVLVQCPGGLVADLVFRSIGRRIIWLIASRPWQIPLAAVL
jgi:hypothetical protein